MAVRSLSARAWWCGQVLGGCGLGWVGVAVDGGSADAEGLGDLGDGGAGGQEGGGCFGALGCPYGGAGGQGA